MRLLEQCILLVGYWLSYVEIMSVKIGVKFEYFLAIPCHLHFWTNSMKFSEEISVTVLYV